VQAIENNLSIAKASITGFGILDGYHGVVVRDHYGGYLSYDAGLADLQQCLAHLYRVSRRPCSATAAPAPTWPGRSHGHHPSPPSATPSPATPGCHHTQYDQPIREP